MSYELRRAPSAISGGEDVFTPQERAIASRERFLDAEEEFRLAQSWKQHRDVAARNRLVLAHVRFAYKIAKKYRGRGTPLQSLRSASLEGLVEAAQRFDPDLGYRFSTFAYLQVRGAVLACLQEHSQKGIKAITTPAAKELFFHLPAAKNQMKIVGPYLTTEELKELARRFAATEEEVAAIDAILSPGRMKLMSDLANVEEDPSAALNPEGISIARSEREVFLALVEDAIALLPEREQIIFRALNLRENPADLGDLGKQFGVSRERARQLGDRALDFVCREVRLGIRHITDEATTALSMVKVAPSLLTYAAKVAKAASLPVGRQQEPTPMALTV